MGNISFYNYLNLNKTYLFLKELVNSNDISLLNK